MHRKIKNEFETNDNSGIQISLPHKAVSNVKFTISNSEFQGMGQTIIHINNGTYATNSTILIKNCKFQDNQFILSDNTHFKESATHPLINIQLCQYNMILHLSKCQFLRNHGKPVLSIHVISESIHDQFVTQVNVSCIFASSVTIDYCSFIENVGSVLKTALVSRNKFEPCLNPVFLANISMLRNNNFDYANNVIIVMMNLFVQIYGHFDMKNNVGVPMLRVNSCRIIFNGLVNFSHNIYGVVMMFQFSDVRFKGIICISNNGASSMHMFHCKAIFNGLIHIHHNIEN